jgi:integrase/recombinase XerD
VGITPIFEAAQMRQLLDSIQITRKIEVPKKHGWDYKEVADIKGLRDRAAIAVMGYTFARESAGAASTIGDYQHEGKCGRLRLMEKGNKEHLVGLHREAEEFLDAYLAVAIEGAKVPLFQSLDKTLNLTGEVISRRDMHRRKELANLGEIERRIAFEYRLVGWRLAIASVCELLTQE